MNYRLGQRHDDALAHALFEHGAHFHPLGIAAVHERVEQDAMKRDVLQEHGHAQVVVDGQVELADFTEAAVLRQTAHARLRHVLSYG
jgi:hypothetical protein